MSNEIFDNVSKYGKSSYDSLKSLYAVNANMFEQLLEQQYALMSLGVEYTTSQLKLAGTAKGYKEVMTGQTDIVSDVNSKLQGISRNTLDIFNESKDEISDWFEKNIKEAEKGMKDVAKVVPVSKAA
ncbi:MAG TPA: TIGR01841 family phasin [Gammaproteobacteria bacterium]|nr:TIGR01841 family phasin [Gammaproteobacteria bacterium]